MPMAVGYEVATDRSPGRFVTPFSDAAHMRTESVRTLAERE
jgi:hypothetical protein